MKKRKVDEYRKSVKEEHQVRHTVARVYEAV